ncbi:MAG: radical SAM protein [Bacillota bacterium]|nr:radical SAM protein [Bacillota bacterium]
MKYKHLFGPVPSRRLGVSLGIDLIPPKTCTLDCVYCECGKTTRLTTERREYIPVSNVLKEVDDYLAQKPELDYITFAGSGEPTLNNKMGQVIEFLKNSYPHYHICVLTNGTLFSDPAIRAEVLKADLIIPSLDAATEKTFQQINRPHPKLNCSKIIAGLVDLRHEFAGEIRLEIFIVPGLNDTNKELQAIKETIEKINPHRIQLGTLDRPGTENWVQAADKEKMQQIASFLGRSELIGEFQPRNKIASFNESYNDQILDTLRRRPCTLEDLQQILNLHPAELQKYINHLLAMGRIETENRDRGTFLKLKTGHYGLA